MWSCSVSIFVQFFFQFMYILCHYHFLQSIPSIYTSLGKTVLFWYCMYVLMHLIIAFNLFDTFQVYAGDQEKINKGDVFDLISASHQVSTCAQRTCCVPDNILMAVVKCAVSHQDVFHPIGFYHLLISVRKLLLLVKVSALTHSFQFSSLVMSGNTISFVCLSPYASVS